MRQTFYMDTNKGIFYFRPPQGFLNSNSPLNIQITIFVGRAAPLAKPLLSRVSKPHHCVFLWVMIIRFFERTKFYSTTSLRSTRRVIWETEKNNVRILFDFRYIRIRMQANRSWVLTRIAKVGMPFLPVFAYSRKSILEYGGSVVRKRRCGDNGQKKSKKWPFRVGIHNRVTRFLLHQEHVV